MAEDFIVKGPCRRPAGKMVLKPLDSVQGMKGRVSYLAENLGGQWSRQAGGYVLTVMAFDKFKILYEGGFTGSLRILKGMPARFEHWERNLNNITLSEAIKAASV